MFKDYIDGANIIHLYNTCKSKQVLD